MRTCQFEFSKGRYSRELNAEFLAQWDSPQTLLLAFFSPGLANHPIWEELRRLFPHSKAAGCSGAGEIQGDWIEDDKAVFTLCRFERSRFELHTQTVSEAQESREAGLGLIQKVPREGLRGLFVLSEGLAINGTELIQGIESGLTGPLPIAGGLAADGTSFRKTYVLEKGIPAEHIVSVIAFYGETLKVTASAEGGWLPFGPQRTVTRSHANVLYEIDGKPALKFYREFLGKLAVNLPASGLLFPIQIGAGATSSRNAVRTLLAIDEKDQSMTFAGDIPQGASIRLMRSGIQDLVGAATTSALRCEEGINRSDPILSLVVSCVGRRLVMGEKTESELEAILTFLPAGSAQTGFYSYGELAPGKTARCDLHNQTLTLTWVQE